MSQSNNILHYRQAPKANMSCESCSDFCEKEFTSFIIHLVNDRGNNGQEYKHARKITLLQHPKESLILDCRITRCMYSRSYNFNLTLKFDNKLHEISQDYDYEISLRALVEINGNSYHSTVFSSRQKRMTDTINLKNEEFYFNIKFGDNLFNSNTMHNNFNQSIPIRHMCCGIRRFNRSSIGQEPSVKNSELPFDYLFRQKLYTDVCLKIGQHELQAHRAILVLRSSVFRAMFSHEETSESRTGVVLIHDIELPVVEEMLHYMYTGRANDGISKFPAKLFKAAHMYEINGLAAMCEEALMFMLNFTNVIEFLNLATLYEMEKLRNSAISFITKYEVEMVKEPSYHDYLCKNMGSNNMLVHTLKLCAKYGLPKIKIAAFEHVKQFTKQVSGDKEYLSLFKTHPDLMQEIFVYINK